MKSKNSERLFLPISIIFLGFTIKCILLARLPSSFFFDVDTHKYLKLSNGFFENYFGQYHNVEAFDTTPGFPLFLFMLRSLTPKQIVFLQLVMLAITQYILFRILRQKFSHFFSLIGLSLFTVEISTNTHTLKLLSETLFLFLITSSIYFVSKVPKKLVHRSLPGLFIGMAIMVRPIGQFIFLAFLIAGILEFKSMKIYMPSICICLSIMTGWIVHNYIDYGVPQLSGIQSYNLLYYEGAGAKSFQSEVPLLEVQSHEISLEHATNLGNTNLARVVDYREKRGITLIFENVKGFTEMHIVGLFKILMGTSKSITSQLLTLFPLAKFTQIFFFTFSLFSSVILLLGTFYAISRLIPKPNVTQDFFLLLIVISFLLLVIVSSGSNAYSRFRVPLVPLEVIMLGYSFDLYWPKLKKLLKY